MVIWFRTDMSPKSSCTEALVLNAAMLKVGIWGCAWFIRALNSSLDYCIDGITMWWATGRRRLRNWDVIERSQFLGLFHWVLYLVLRHFHYLSVSLALLSFCPLWVHLVPTICSLICCSASTWAQRQQS